MCESPKDRWFWMPQASALQPDRFRRQAADVSVLERSPEKARYIARAMPSGANAVLLGHDSDLSRGGEAADLGDVAADVVDELLLDER